jgi:hypothetical protein
VSVNGNELPTLKQLPFPEYIVATACLLIKQANQAMMGRGNALDRGSGLHRITLDKVFSTSLCENKFKSKMQSKTVLTWASCLHYEIILPQDVKGGDRNLLNEHQIYPYLATMAPIIPPYNANKHQFDKVKDLLPYCDKVLFPKEKTVKKPISKDLVDTNHEEWTPCHLEEFERCQKTCLWNQQKELLVEEEYVPFESQNCLAG